jgi:broad specificity phosphatase PhoE
LAARLSDRPSRLCDPTATLASRHRRARNTATEIIETLNTAINAILTDREVERRLHDLGGVPMPPAEFGKLIAAETEK